MLDSCLQLLDTDPDLIASKDDDLSNPQPNRPGGRRLNEQSSS